MNKMTLCLLGLLFSANLFGQVRFWEAGLEVCSRHIWRGDMLGTAPAFEPSATLGSGHFSFNLWASVTPNNSYSEIDLVPSWQFRNFQLTIFDYYNPVPGEQNRYLQFWKKEGRHSLEVVADNYSVEAQRFKWFAGTFLAGDRNENTGNAFFSTYFELKYPFAVWGIGAEPVVGLTPFRGYYASRAAVVNSGIALGKELTLGPTATLPFSVAYVYNPYKNKSYLTFSVGIFFAGSH